MYDIIVRLESADILGGNFNLALIDPYSYLLSSQKHHNKWSH